MKTIKSIYVKVGDKEIPIGSCKLDLFIICGKIEIVRLDKASIDYEVNDILFEK